jgi:hypothetical protein
VVENVDGEEMFAGRMRGFERGKLVPSLTGFGGAMSILKT